MSVFYTSDLHIGHAKVAGIRGFKKIVEYRESGGQDPMWEDVEVVDTEAHDRDLARVWDSMVKPDDIVYVLGDTGMSNFDKVVLPWFAERPGTKHLIAGNHDPVHPARSDALKLQPKWLKVFATISPYATRKAAGHKFLLSHFPYGAKVSRYPGDHLGEIWKETAYPGYLVSSSGKVRGRFGRVLRPYYTGAGYLAVRISRGPTVSVHRLVCEAFHGPKPAPDMQVAHNNGKSTDNRASNLRWATPLENAQDKKLHGTQFAGSSALSSEQIRELLVSEESTSRLAEKFNVSTNTILRHRPSSAMFVGGDALATDDTRWNEWRLPESDVPLLHGHTHGEEMDHDQMLHVGWDAWGRPVHESEVLFWLNGR